MNNLAAYAKIKIFIRNTCLKFIMKKPIAILLVLVFVCVPLSFTINAALSDKVINTTEIKPMPNGEYKLPIEANQWRFSVFDPTIYFLEENIHNVDDRKIVEIRDSARIKKHSDLQFPRGVSVEISLWSRDVQHGIEIEALYFILYSTRPTPEEIFGDPVSKTVTFPYTDAVYTIQSALFVGLGTEDMTFKIYILDPYASIPSFYFISFLFGLLPLITIYFTHKIYQINKTGSSNAKLRIYHPQ